ncbi:MAG TPA: hypothetical protein VKA80_01215 [Beijerinckiaceae bacterium]|nr:hypothetical protein [Beijerinckiaceae bacterium]
MRSAFGADAEADAVPGEARVIRRLAAAQEDARAVGDRRASGTHAGELVVREMHSVGEDHTLAQQPDGLHVARRIEAALGPHPVDLALALGEMDRRDEPALARDPVDGLEKVGGAGIGGMRPEDHADAASRAFVEPGEELLEGGKAGLALEAALRGARDRGIADRACGREQVGGRIEPKAPAFRELEDRGLPRAELVDERGRAAAREFEEAQRDERLELAPDRGGRPRARPSA